MYYVDINVIRLHASNPKVMFQIGSIKKLENDMQFSYENFAKLHLLQKDRTDFGLTVMKLQL